MRFGTFSYNQCRPTVSEKQAFDELIEQILLTENLGFDEAWFAEHHHSDYGMLSSPNLIIASLARRTQRLRMGNLVSVLPLYEPMRFAEECSILDTAPPWAGCRALTERYPYYPGGLTVGRLDEWATSLIGSPDTVIKKARAMLATAKPDSLVGMFSFGGLKHEQVMHSLELFGTKVIPALGA